MTESFEPEATRPWTVALCGYADCNDAHQDEQGRAKAAAADGSHEAELVETQVAVGSVGPTLQRLPPRPKEDA